MLASDPAFREADQLVCRQLAGLLTERYKENKDKIQIVPVSKVYSYLRSHPEWMMESKRALGKKFDADLLVYLEFGPMSQYEPLSNLTMYRGKVDIRITVIEVDKPDGECTKFDPTYSCVYPTTHPEDATSMNLATFRAKFLDRVARDLVRYFATHPREKMVTN